MRGGQKGNQNARKHGFYSRTLSPAEINEFWNITSRENIDPEMALVRLKLQSFLRNDPGNPRVLEQASKLLARWFRSKYCLNRADSSYLNALIESLLEHYLSASTCPPDPQTNVSDKNESSVL